jgi:hypothetical protein
MTRQNRVVKGLNLIDHKLLLGKVADKHINQSNKMLLKWVTLLIYVL